MGTFLLFNYYYSILNIKPNSLEGSTDSDDEKLRSKSQGSLVEFRRLKRILMARKKKKLIFQKTPTPNDFDRNSSLHDVLFNNHKTKNNLIPNYVSNNIFYPTDSLICDADFHELELIRQFISEKKKNTSLLKMISAKYAFIRKRVTGLNSSIGKNKIPLSPKYQNQSKISAKMAKMTSIKIEKRIPRRGEVGLTTEQIEKYEKIGYVMSGSRHARMNAIRMRKENQVYTAQEKAALAMLNLEENKAKEKKILKDLKYLIKRSIT